MLERRDDAVGVVNEGIVFGGCRRRRCRRRCSLALLELTHGAEVCIQAVVLMVTGRAIVEETKRKREREETLDILLSVAAVLIMLAHVL